MPIKALIVDDSAFIRATLTRFLESAPGIQVVGAVNDPIMAIDKIRLYDPDVITLDLEMPKMDGLTFLHRLMTEEPRPVVMISSWTAKNSEAYLKALSYGAFDCIDKPALGMKEGMEARRDEIVSKVVQAAQSRKKIARLRERSVERIMEPDAQGPLLKESSAKIIAIGASTGGTVAITEILRRLPTDLPGILIVQHMPAFFTPSFAASLNQQTPITVKEANGRERISDGRAWLAPGGYQMKAEQDGAVYVTRILPGQPGELHKPSVDVTFHSIAANVGRNAMGVLLTGMGEDGARGLKAMREAGAYTVAQDEATSVVYGMPGKAAEIGAAEKILPLQTIANEIILWASRQRKAV